MGEYANDVLVGTDWLAENIDNPDVRIVEVDEDTEAYERGHIRNALGVNWKSDLQDSLRRDFISGPDFEKLCAKPSRHAHRAHEAGQGALFEL